MGGINVLDSLSKETRDLLTKYSNKANKTSPFHPCDTPYLYDFIYAIDKEDCDFSASDLEDFLEKNGWNDKNAIDRVGAVYENIVEYLKFIHENKGINSHLECNNVNVKKNEDLPCWFIVTILLIVIISGIFLYLSASNSKAEMIACGFFTGIIASILVAAIFLKLTNSMNNK